MSSTKLEALKIKMELSAVLSARAAMEFKIAEHQDQIQRLEEHMKAQDLREKELSEKLESLKE